MIHQTISRAESSEFNLTITDDRPTLCYDKQVLFMENIQEGQDFAAKVDSIIIEANEGSPPYYEQNRRIVEGLKELFKEYDLSIDFDEDQLDEFLELIEPLW